MAATVAAHLVKVHPDNPDWWIALACGHTPHDGRFLLSRKSSDRRSTHEDIARALGTHDTASPSASEAPTRSSEIITAAVARSRSPGGSRYL